MAAAPLRIVARSSESGSAAVRAMILNDVIPHMVRASEGGRIAVFGQTDSHKVVLRFGVTPEEALAKARNLAAIEERSNPSR